MHGINGMNIAMGEMMLEYDKYTKKCESEGREALSFLRFFVGSLKGTLDY